MARNAAKSGRGNETLFKVLVIHGGGRKLVTLKLHCRPSDDIEPVVTITYPHED